MGNILRKKGTKLVEGPKFRHVIPNHLIPDDIEPNDHPNHTYHSNRIKTTKYTVWSFIPKNLFEQFHRFANLYFLFIVLLNWVPQVNAFAKEVAMIPVILVLAVTAIKDAFEDWRRYQSDNKVNHLPCRVYCRKDRRYNRREWQDIKCGDIIHLSCNEVIPSDIVLLRTSDQTGLCHIDTTNIDGESNLKQCHVVKSLRQGDEFHPTLFTHTIECELPNLEVYKFHGAMLTPLNEKIPITKNNILLRGCILRNTDFVEGIVVYAGHETKALLNNRGPRYKRSKVERQINRDVVWCVILLLVMCFLSALGTGLWNANLPNNMLAPYIPYESLSEFSAPYQGFIRFWTYVILYQVVIPLSLYVTIELVKIGQIYLISHDRQLYDPQSNKRIECRALNITEDLGQIEYIFSDKTGTLTENEMVFRSCAIGGVNYGSLPDHASPVTPVSPGAEKPRDDGFVKLNLATDPTTHMNVESFTPDPTLKQIVTSLSLTDVPLDIPVQTQRIWDFFLLLTLCNTVVVSLHGHQDKEIEEQDRSITKQETPKETPNVELVAYWNTSKMDATGYIHEDSSVDIKPRSIPDPSAPGSHTASSSLSSKSGRGSLKKAGVKSMLRKHRHKLKDIFAPISSSPLTLRREPLENERGSSGEEDEVDDDCEVTDTDTSMLSENTLKTKYEAESPDELALVQAACSYGCRLLQRTPGLVTLWLPREGEVSVRILHILHFDSERKRMSVIIQHPTTSQIILYCKGADSAIMPQLRFIQADDVEMKRLVRETQFSVTQFAKQGLRTLCMAKKVLTLGEYQKWVEYHREVEASLEHRERKLHESACKIENNLELLGVTGMEDRLQTGVPETIACLRDAGLNVWVLTGDKQETALNVANACNLISFDQEMIILNAKNLHMTKELLESKLEYMDILHGEATSNPTGYNDMIVTPSGELRERRHAKDVALVIDGKTLGFVQQEKVCRDIFLRIAQQCNSVLCCRATPAQKAYLVKLIQEKLHKLALAIGDGANDVNMIQTADIGIGISGKEGMQAVMASDFALARFCFLKRLLLVHGHWCYDRLARMTLYMFFKNTVFVVLLMWFQIYSGYSGGSMVDDLNLILFNLVYTSLPPIVFGIFDKDVPADLLMTRPALYRQGIVGLAYKRHSYFICVLEAIWQSLVQFYIPYLAYADSDVGLWEFGMTSLAGCIWATLLHMCIETRCWSVFHVSVILISLLLFYGFNVVYSVVIVVGSPPANPHWVYVNTLTTPIHWLLVILTVIIALAPRFLIRSLEGTFHPSATVMSRQKLESYPSYSDHNVFATWTAVNNRSHDFEHLQEEEVTYPGTKGHMSTRNKLQN